ncbi:MAG: HAD-superfamily hydrolase, subfamily variant 3 [Deltaproteobacteria bacterium]|jgi:putative hydrolase of the HAD superfamily|nr:HAD-superfamily hydrolase, subfamily variant 3 [Deltaproteobacteria bacterium]
MDDIIRTNGKIDVVLFDFGGVLAEEGFKQGLIAVARANGVDENAFVQAAFDTIYSSGYVLGKAPESQFWDALRKKTGVKGDDASLRHAIFSRFILRDWMIAVVKKLKANNIRVGILSDQTDLLEELDKKYDFYRLFNYIFNSYRIGKGKRDPGLFDDVAQTVKAKPDRILFIDDDPGHVERARQRGWKAMLYVERDGFQKELGEILPLLL